MTRDIEDLDIENHESLRKYLVCSGHLGADEEVTAHNLSGGVSNRAVLVELPQRDEAWVLKQALQKLRVAVDWFSDPARIEREAMGLRTINELAPGTTPRLVFEDKANYILAMQAVPQPHENWKTMLLRGEVFDSHIQQFAAMLAKIHSVSWRRRECLQPQFAERSFFESLRIEPYYEYSAQQVCEAAPFLNKLIEETRMTSLCVVHGDYSPKNILVFDDKLILLDHEVIHWGDPAFDLGFALAHLLSKAHHLTSHRVSFLRAAQLFWKKYCAQLGEVPWRKNIEARAVRHTLACWLARVVGRSPLEYLSPHEKAHQQSIAIELMHPPPGTLQAMVEEVGARLATTTAGINE